MVTLSSLSGGSLVAFKVSGRVTGESWDEVSSAMQRAVDEHNTINCLVELEGFEGWTVEGAWERIKMHYRYLRNTEKVAFVSTDNSALLCSYIFSTITEGVPCESFAKRSEALDWLLGDQASRCHSVTA